MPATTLRCRVCETQYPLDPIGVCARCFGPLDPVYDRDAQRRTVSRASIEAGPPSIWRYADLLPVAAPQEQRLPPGFTPLVQAPRLAETLGLGELWLKLDTANPTHSFKDRVVAVAAAKALELGRTTLSCSSTGNLANAVAARAAAEGIEAVVLVPASLEPEKLIATSIYGAAHHRRRGQLRRLQPAQRRAVVRARLGVLQRRPSLVLRRGLEDARVRDRRAARLEPARRGDRADRIRLDVHEGPPGLRRAPRARARATARRRASSADRAKAAHPLRSRSPTRRR